MTRYGYIGLGDMGSAMVSNLVQRVENLTVYDVDPAPLEVARSAGAAVGASPREVAESSDVISICVPAADHIASVMTGEGGIAEGRHEGLSIVIHSTVSPETVRRNRDLAAGWGVALFDACVAGGSEQARSGEQLVLAGGVADMPDDVRDLLNIYATTVIDAGPVGAGAALKIAFNVMTYAQFAAAATGYDLMAGSGGDPQKLLDAWRHEGQLGKLTDRFVALLDLPEEFIAGDLLEGLRTQAGIGDKDLTLAEEMGEMRRGGTEFIRGVREVIPAAYRAV